MSANVRNTNGGKSGYGAAKLRMQITTMQNGENGALSPPSQHSIFSGDWSESVINWLPRNGSNAVPFLLHWVSGQYWVKAEDDAIEEKPTIHRFRHVPPRAPGQPQPWPAYEPPGDTTPRYNNHTIIQVDVPKCSLQEMLSMQSLNQVTISW